MIIRPAEHADRDPVWDVLEPVLREGATYTYPRDISKADALAAWMGPDRETLVAKEDGKIIGTYYLRANQVGGGSHVANCGFVTDRAAGRRGVARRMCAHSLELARERGFLAMQYNFVIATNTHAIRLWESFGFETVGRLPGVFNHPEAGYVDALVMYRRLQ